MLLLITYHRYRKSYEFHTSTTERVPNHKCHLTVRFSTNVDRTKGWGYTVHIRLDPNTKRWTGNLVSWGSGTPDKHNQKVSFEDRSSWPDGVDAKTAPWCPGEEASAHPQNAAF